MLVKLSWAGLVTRKVSTKGFELYPYISSSLPKLAWRNSIDRSSAGPIRRLGVVYRESASIGYVVRGIRNQTGQIRPDVDRRPTAIGLMDRFVKCSSQG